MGTIGRQVCGACGRDDGDEGGGCGGVGFSFEFSGRGVLPFHSWGEKTRYHPPARPIGLGRGFCGRPLTFTCSIFRPYAGTILATSRSPMPTTCYMETIPAPFFRSSLNVIIGFRLAKILPTTIDSLSVLAGALITSLTFLGKVAGPVSSTETSMPILFIARRFGGSEMTT